METKIKSVRENPLLERKKVEVELKHEGEPTPSEEDIKNRLAAENNLETDEIEVKTIYTGYGSNTSKATLNVHQDFEYEEDLEINPAEKQLEETKKEEPVEEEDSGEDYSEIVSGTITEAKNTLEEMEEPDYQAALKAEKNQKNRKTLTNWLEKQG